MRMLSYLALLIIMLIGLTFASLNADVVFFNYYLGKKEITLSLLLVFTFGLGICLGLLIMLFSLIKAKSDIIRVRARLKNTEKEVENLRSIPIKGD